MQAHTGNRRRIRFADGKLRVSCCWGTADDQALVLANRQAKLHVQLDHHIGTIAIL